MENSSSCKKIDSGYIQKNITKLMKIIEGFVLRNVMGQATVIGEGVEQINFNKLITLNSSSEFLWKEVAGKEFDTSMLAELLMKEYGIDSGLAAKDAACIAQKWIEIGLVRE